MSEDQNPAPAPESGEAGELGDRPKPAARRKAPSRSPRKKAASSPTAADEAVPPPNPKRAPRKPKPKASDAAEPVADLFAALAVEAGPLLEGEARIAEAATAGAGIVPAEPGFVAAAIDGRPGTDAEGDDADTEAGTAPGDHEPADPSRRRRKRRRDREERAEAAELPAGPTEDAVAPEAVLAVEVEGSGEAVEAVLPAAESTLLPPLTVVSLGLEQPPVLSADALTALRGARVVLGSAEALDRLAGLGLEAPQELCGAETIHLDLRRLGHAGSVLAVLGDGAGDGPAAELLAELGPAHVRLLPGVGRVQAACASLGLSAEIVSVVDLRRAPLAALRGQLRAHRLFAVPVADAGVPAAVAGLLVESGFAKARVWVCEFPGGSLAGARSTAWLATELAELRDTIDPHAVLIIATGPSSGVFSELPGLSDAALGEDAPAALPLAARLLALAWLQPAAWETGWAIADGEASLALEWARAVPTARVRAVGVDPSLIGVTMAGAGVGENLAAVAAATPSRCREWPTPDAVFVRGGVGLSGWLEAAWESLAPGGRLVATAEDDHARADLLAFAARVPAEAWQELSLARGETRAGRLRFAPAAPVRLALWRKEAP